jgi:hypothetical protein
MDPTADNPAGGRRRRRAKDEAHVRDVLLALGGSTQELDEPNDGSAQDASLDSRIDAYTRLARNRRAPEPAAIPPAPAAAAAALAAAEPAPAPAEAPAPPLPAPIPIAAEAAPAAPPPIPIPVEAAPAPPPPSPIPVETTPAPPAPTPIRIEPAPKPARARRRPRPVRRRPRLEIGVAVRRAALAVVGVALGLAHFFVHAVKLVARALLRAARSVASKLTQVVRVGARLVLHAARRLGAALAGARAALKRPERPPEEEHVSLGVSARVKEWSDHDDTAVLADEEVPAAEAGVALFDASPPEQRSSRSWTPGAGSALLSVLALVLAGAAFTLVLTLRGHGGREAQTQPVTTTSEPPQPVPQRTAYSDPRGYAAAMTRFALTSGHTAIDGTPVCVQGSTYDRWTCRARGRPEIGAYAGRWLTFRCSPHSTPQPGGQPAVMINCRPDNPPPLTA